jgi:hypothetical protein
MLLRSTVGGLLLGFVLAAPDASYAQDTPAPSEPPTTVPVRFGPIALAPTLTLTNVGWDSNVFNQPSDVNPPDDFTAVLRPEVRAWLRLGRARLSGRGTVDFFYFRDFQNERSVDYDQEAWLQLPLARVRPYVSGRWARAQQQFTYEIDQRVLRHEESQLVGAEFRLGRRTSFDLHGRRDRLNFDDQPSFGDPLVTQFYDLTSQGIGLTFRQQLTPLTSFAIAAGGQHDRFDTDPLRDTDSLRVSAGFEFKPFALISGKAYAGWQQVELSAPGSSTFTGVVASVDLAYTLLGATRFTVQGQRDISYSAIRGQHAYLLSGATLLINHRLNGQWDLGARVGRHRLSYGVFAPTGSPDVPPPLSDTYRETVTQYGGDIGYRLGPDTRMAINVSHSTRGSTEADGREYERTQVGWSLEYRF